MIIIPFIIIGAVVIGIAIILVRMIVAPKRVAHLKQLHKQGRHQQSIKIAKQILQKNPRNIEAHYFLGLSYLGDNKPELALMEFKLVNQASVFEGEIREIPFRTVVADLYFRFNQLEEAQKEYLLLINLEPGNPANYYQAGRLLELRNHPDKAVRYYRKTIELDKRHADSYARLGSILFRAKKLGEAKEALEQAVKLQPANAQACFTLGKICKESHDYQGALTFFEKASKDNEIKGKVLLERGTCYISIGDLDRAVSELERSLKLTTDEASNEAVYAHYLLAYCHEQNRRYEEAIFHWERIQTKKPGFRDVAAKLAQYLEYKSDDKLKDFLTTSDESFLTMCRNIVVTQGLSVQDEKKVSNGVEILAGESTTKWRNTKKQPILYRFVRETDPIEEPSIREFHEKVRSGGLLRGVFLTSSVFSRGAREFAESRPLELVDKDKLTILLAAKE